jgi:hypothetical protein
LFISSAVTDPSPVDQTLAAAPADVQSNPIQLTAVVAQITPQMTLLQTLITAADLSIKATPTHKREETDLVQRQEVCDEECVRELISLIVTEISGTIRNIIFQLGTSE